MWHWNKLFRHRSIYNSYSSCSYLFLPICMWILIFHIFSLPNEQEDRPFFLHYCSSWCQASLSSFSFFVISWSSKITSSFLCSLLLFLWWLKNKLYFYDCFVTFQKIDKNLLIKKIDNLVIMVMHFQVVMKCAEKQIEYEETATKASLCLTFTMN